MRRSPEAGLIGGFCGCVIAFVALNLTIGSILFDYCLWVYAGKDIPWYGDMVCGLFLGEVAIPAAVIGWVLTLCGVPTPIFGG